MSVNLPYIPAPGSLSKALERIKAAATPPRVTQDFVKTKLNIPGGSGDAITSFLKKIGFTDSDGAPSRIYTEFRNPATAGHAVAEAIRIGYAPLYEHNEYLHELSDEELKGLILQVTGLDGESRVPYLIMACIKNLKEYADFEAITGENQPDTKEVAVTAISEPKIPPARPVQKHVGMNLSYTINLNLPATSDIAVFNAIFKSLKDNLLGDAGE